MHFLLDFLPVVLFFAAYYAAGLYWATGVAIVASLVQVSVTWYLKRRVERMQIVSLVLIVVLGGATLLLQDERFVKFKPTALYWALACALLGTQWFGRRPGVYHLMGHAIRAPERVWSRLNLIWAGFFAFAGALNLWVAQSFTTEVWVNFKLFGLLALTLVFVLAQGFYIARHAEASGAGPD